MYSVNTTASISFPNGISANCLSGQSSAVFALYHNPEYTQPFVPDDSVGIEESARRMAMNARVTITLICAALGLRSTEASITAPCSVKA